MPGRFTEIYTAPSAEAPMEPSDSIRAIAGCGLEGDRYALKIGT